MNVDLELAWYLWTFFGVSGVVIGLLVLLALWRIESYLARILRYLGSKG